MYTCVGNVTDEKNRIIGYKIQREDGKVATIDKERLKRLLKYKRVEVDNLVLGGNGVIQRARRGPRGPKASTTTPEEIDKERVFMRLYHSYYNQTGNYFSGVYYNALENDFCSKNNIHLSKMSQWVIDSIKRIKPHLRKQNRTAFIIALEEECPEFIYIAQQGIEPTWEKRFNELLTLVKSKSKYKGDYARSVSAKNCTGTYRDMQGIFRWINSQREQNDKGTIGELKKSLIMRIIPGVFDVSGCYSNLDYIIDTFNYEECLAYRGY